MSTVVYETKGLLKVIRSHVHCNCRSILKTVTKVS